MKQFEQQLLNDGSLELICSYVKEHKEVLSAEFKSVLANKIKGILNAFDFQVFYSDDIITFSQSKDEILNMTVENFLQKYSYRKPSTFFLNKCQENNIATARDLYEFGRFNLLKIHNVGKKTLTMVIDAFDVAGIHRF